jgi:putative transposase
LWLQREEGAKFWLGVLTELRNRGLVDVLIVCCDGLTGFPDAIETTWPHAIVQTCVVHLIRNSIKFCSWKDRKAITKALKPIYQAASLDGAADALDTFEIEWGDRYPAIVDLWRRNWERFTPFLAFDPAIRRIIYTTNAIESLNYQLRKITKTRGHFPTDEAVLKILYLGIRNIGHERGGELGTGTHGWTQALNAFAIHFPARLTIR